MSVSVNVYVLVGVNVAKSQLYKSRKTRGCGHQEPWGGQFCGQCGKPVWATQDEWIDGCDGETLLGFKLILSPEEVRADEAFVCTRLSRMKDDPLEGGWGQEPLLSGDEQEDYRRLEQALAPLGLWDAGTFGTWVVGICYG